MRSLLGLGLVIMLGSCSQSPETTPYSFPEMKGFPEMPVSVENPVTKEGVELGRFLFYDPILSRDSTEACVSCHRQENAFSDASRPLSRGIDGKRTRRNSPGLFNLAWYESMFWDGRSLSIEEQVFHPVRDPVELDIAWTEVEKRINKNPVYLPYFKRAFGEVEYIDSTLISKAIGQFERTLLSYNSKYDRVIRGEDQFTKDELKGFELMTDASMANCFQCHEIDHHRLATTGKFANNGLEKAFRPEEYKDKGLAETTGKIEDVGKFKIPSLRNVMITPPYMHDGRFRFMEDVIDFYSEGVNESFNVDSKMSYAHRGGVRLNEEEKKQIIAFLYTLTDSTFMTNPEYGYPGKMRTLNEDGE